MQLLIKVSNRSNVYKEFENGGRNFIVDVDPSGNVQCICKALSERTGIPDFCFKVILCGRMLAHDTPIQSLLLGPYTSVSVFITDATGDEKEAECSSCKSDNFQCTSSFQVYCKNCGSVKQGKLRVYCFECSSSSILLKREPIGWNDVLPRLKIIGDCQNCRKDVFAHFCFRCVSCGEAALPLIHCRGGIPEMDCCICGERILNVVVDFGCHHSICLDCFIAYMKTSFIQQQFILRPQYGYTLSCPMYSCNSFVTDPHHFYLLGKENYEVYKRQAAEKFVTLQTNGIFCPNPKCGAAFIWEREVNQRKVRCPHCECFFCGECNLQKCICDEADATRITIQTTCKKCPSCGAATERNGGCTHIHCIHCNAHWCFLCVKLWSEDCQWNHWFD